MRETGGVTLAQFFKAIALITIIIPILAILYPIYYFKNKVI